MPVRNPGSAIVTDPYKVYLLATDKDEPTMYTLMSYDASNMTEKVITEVPYRRDCSLACLGGKTHSSLKLKHPNQNSLLSDSHRVNHLLCALNFSMKIVTNPPT